LVIDDWRLARSTQSKATAGKAGVPGQQFVDDRQIMKPEHLQLLLSREMPYGKYKGRVIADLPGHYLGWFAREGFPRGEIGELLALMYELDHNDLRSLLDPLRGRR
jgi:uncharacterized protein (DUF3820 family)